VGKGAVAFAVWKSPSLIADSQSSNALSLQKWKVP
jgi:hypothetical protein